MHFATPLSMMPLQIPTNSTDSTETLLRMRREA
jgi:hypothetical protein